MSLAHTTKRLAWIALFLFAGSKPPAAAHEMPASGGGADTGEPPRTGEEGEPSASDLAKAVQNPVADLISVPFQNNINYNIGTFDRAQNILNLQPVVPIHLSEDWLVISRTIVPFVYQPNIGNTGGGSSGLGDINPTFFLAPAKSGHFIWGVGPVLLFPTATQRTTGNGKWGAGPSAVALVQTKHWTIGALANNIWSFAGAADRSTVNQFLLQYFVNYNLPDAWYLTSAPILTANWEASGGDRWLVPFGAGIGKIIKLGKLPLNGQVSGYYNAIRPDNPPSPTWQLRIQLAFLFPTEKPKPKASADASARVASPPGCPVAVGAPQR